MASKKYYAVKKGKVTGVMYSWDECKASVDGYPGAQYKGFSTLAEAYAYLGMGSPEGEKTAVVNGDSVYSVRQGLSDDTLLAYVDGSFKEEVQKYSFGCVFLLPDGRIYVQKGNGSNPLSLQHQNVSGEMLGAMYAVKVAMMNGYAGIELRYDYEGIEKWVTGEWRSKTELTQKYTAAMREWMQSIRVKFTKVEAHTNVTFNELADQLAKQALVEGDGIPKVKKLEEMESYGTDAT